MTELRSHRVARAAFEAVVARRDAPFRKAYVALLKGGPGMILVNGLAQTSGFLLAKARDEHLALHEDLRTVLVAAGATRAEDARALHAEIIEADFARTMRLTRSALDACAWMKRYAQGAFVDGDDGATVPK